MSDQTFSLLPVSQAILISAIQGALPLHELQF